MTDFLTLKTDIANVLARDDLNSDIPLFVRLCEAAIRRKVKVRAMETAADITIDARSEAVPAGFISVRRLSLDVDDGGLTYMTPERLYESRIYREQGTPEVYTIEGDNFVFAPEPSTSITGKLLYYKAFDALSGDTDTNWLLNNAYDVYLYGALVHSAPFIGEDERIATWNGFYTQAIDGVNKMDQWSRVSGSSLIATGRSTP